MIPRDDFGIGPQFLDGVVGPYFRLKQVDDDVDEVREDPGVGGVLIGAEQRVAVIAAKVLEVIGDGAHLFVAGAGGDEDVITDLAESADVHEQYVLAVPIFEKARGFDGEVTPIHRVCRGIV